MAASVSAVSPDWLIPMTRLLGVMIGSRYRNSEALSTSTGTRASDSIINFPTCAACSDVPIPTICRRSTPAKKSALPSSRPTVTVSSVPIRPRNVSRMARLLMDFLEHEVRVAFLFRHLRGPVDGLRRLAHALALGILDLDAVAGDDSDLAVFEEDDAACIGQQRRNVGGDEVFSRSHTHHQWRPVACGHDLAAIAFAGNNGDPIHPFHIFKRAADGPFQVTPRNRLRSGAAGPPCRFRWRKHGLRPSGGA